MPCIVPTCGASVDSFRLFPTHLTLSERWIEAIQVGCGVKVDEDSHNLGLKEICQWHFGKSSDEMLYQEPKIFLNCEEGREMEIDSCRLCLRFYPSCDMVSKKSKLSTGTDIKLIVYESLRINLQSNDFLKLICIECLARLEVLKSIQKDFNDAENKFHNLVSIIWDNSNEISKPIELTVEVIKQEDNEESNSDSDGGILEEDSGDEWIPPKASVDGPVKSKIKSTSCDDSEQPEVSFKDIISRKCYICPVVLEDENELSSHLTENHSNLKASRCEECSQDFPILSAYNKHLSHHDQTGKVEKTKPFTCATCGEPFMYLIQLKSHIRREHASTDKPKCRICSKTFATRQSLERHTLLHTNEKPYICSICDAPFRRPIELKHHVQKVHEGKNPHVCVECNQEFKSSISLYKHKQFVHLNKPQSRLFKCKLCNEIFMKNSVLQKHISISHANDSYPVLECPHCPRTFVSMQSLCMHKATHTDKCLCKECGKRFASFHSLKNHIGSIHEKRQFDCPICLTKTYKSQSALQMHMTIHTKGRQFLCEICDKSFHRKDHLTIHRRLHTDEKPFECPNCLKRLSSNGSFWKHKKRCQATSSKIKEEMPC